MKIAKKILGTVVAMSVCCGQMFFGGVQPLTVEAETTILGLEMNSSKTEYTLEEIQNGAKATVYVDVNTEISPDAGLTIIEFGLLPKEGWGYVDPVNLRFDDPNVLSTDRGSSFEYDEMDTGGSVTGSIWTNNNYYDVYHACYNFRALDAGGPEWKYDNNNLPNATLMTNTSLGFFRTGGEGEHLATFDVEFPTDLAEGTYTIDFANATAAINYTGNAGDLTYEKIKNTGSITFTILNDGQTTPVVTTTVTTEPNETIQTTVSETEPIETTQVIPVETSLWNFVGSCEIKADANINAKTGDTIQIPVYIDTYGMTIEGIGAKVVYDETALKLTDIIDPRELGYTCSGLEEPCYELIPSINTFLITLKNAVPMMNYPEYPIVILEFNVLEGVEGTYEINFENNLFSERDIEVVQSTYPGEMRENDYLKATTVPGYVVIENSGVPIITTAPSDETPATTETTVTEPTEPGDALNGDANGDNKINIRDAATIASAMAKGIGDTLPKSADFNGDGKINVRDAAALASALAKGEIID